MRVCLDVCCLNRPFDDQSQERIRLESEAVKLVFDLVAKGLHAWISSEAVEFEISRHPDDQQRLSLQVLISLANERLIVDSQAATRAAQLESAGIPAMDAVHLAVAEQHGCDVFLTTDDTLMRRVARLGKKLQLRVANPVQWIAEVLEP
ncbi:MAG: PIN domain-containing protein [Planctomycetes bacterium]|nr:PIN domain-containing protein [Planctomycetota bacterium]